MQLANYIVGYSLEINSRCLRYLADCDVRGDQVPNAPAVDQLSAEAHTVYAESLLARESRRLVSMRALAGLVDDWSVAEPQATANADYERHAVRLVEVAAALSDAASPRRLALRLAAIASDDADAQAMLFIARRLPLEIAPSWDQLNDVFARDSRYWRNAKSFRELSDERLVHRMAKNYRRAYQRGTHLLDSLEEESGGRSHMKSVKLQRWAELTAHQLELLRPRLSEKGKAQAWYLDKLADTLRMRQGLLSLQQAVRSSDTNLDKAVRKLGRRYVEQQIHKMDQRLLRLAQSCFTMRPKKMRRRLAEAASTLSLTPAVLRPVGWQAEHMSDAEDLAASEDAAPVRDAAPSGASGTLDSAAQETEQETGQEPNVGEAVAGESTIERAMRLHAQANKTQDTGQN